MRISELVAESGIPLPTVKYYLREGLLHPGVAAGSRRASYDRSHLHRLRVIKALTETAALPLTKVKVILELIDHPDPDLFRALGTAVGALPPYVEPVDDHPRAREVLGRLGQVYDPHYPAVAQLEQALSAAEQAGLAISADRIDLYGAALRQVAAYDVARMPEADGASASIEYAVLGTALYEPVLLALWRLAHQHVAAEQLGANAVPPAR